MKAFIFCGYYLLTLQLLSPYQSRRFRGSFKVDCIAKDSPEESWDWRNVPAPEAGGCCGCSRSEVCLARTPRLPQPPCFSYAQAMHCSALA